MQSMHLLYTTNEFNRVNSIMKYLKYRFLVDNVVTSGGQAPI